MRYKAKQKGDYTMADALPQVVPVNIISGFLGAGKTTLINKLLDEGYGSTGCALIENEFGDIPIDDNLVESDTMDVRTLAQGCICCTLKVDFVKCLRSLVQDFHPTRIIIEPTGIASASQIVDMCKLAKTEPPLQVESVVTVVDATEAEEMIDFELPPYLRQLDEARFILLSRAQLMEPDALQASIDAVSRYCDRDVLVESCDWGETDALEIMEKAAEAFSEGGSSLNAGGEYAYVPEPEPEPDDDEAEAEAEGAEGGHEHHHHHHEVEGFTSYAFRPEEPFDVARLQALRDKLANPASGMVLRAKGFLKTADGETKLYQMVRGSDSLTPTTYSGGQKIVVIGRGIDAHEFEEILGHHSH